ncbi:S8 family serine peptidase [Halorubellus sp. JP-L1]|uniref:S8 family serine peptidase n=1 Tax=Halorubellus sp. JP-L1 TaxID=2715753 RepID=UPI00140912A6|nr:S8 family serine peptidase [Halorubellus sp. JP-L1]NHN42687.1 S8 family serine peptidase [Halorubellus sp. JP-L1]
MVDNDRRVSRRQALKVAGSAVVGASAAGLASGSPAEKVEVNVGYTGVRGQAAAEKAADSVSRRFGFDAITAEVPKSAIEGLSKNPNIRYVEVNGQMHAIDPIDSTGGPPGSCDPWPDCDNEDDGGDTSQSLEWGVDRVDAEVAHANGETGAGADVAILDTGIDSDHPDLQANLGAGKAYATCNGCNESWDDDNDHGTHCAGIAGADDNSEGVVGVSTEATLHAVKVLDSQGSGSFSDIAAGVEYVADQGWDVASMSLGASSGSSALQDAVQYAADRGVFLVAAAGNSGPCSDCVGYPAAYSEVVAVSSTASDDSLSSFSSTGSEVEIAAPGSDVRSTIPGGYDTFSGTSMACPHVAGAAGQLMAGGASASNVRSTLKSSAEDIGLASNESGSGLLDVASALGLDSSDN